MFEEYYDLKRSKVKEPWNIDTKTFFSRHETKAPVTNVWRDYTSVHCTLYVHINCHFDWFIFIFHFSFRKCVIIFGAVYIYFRSTRLLFIHSSICYCQSTKKRKSSFNFVSVVWILLYCIRRLKRNWFRPDGMIYLGICIRKSLYTYHIQ